MKKTLLKGALIIALGGFFSKLIGAIYRIPLTNLLKSEGLGLYQMVFPVYCILLDLSGAGIPSGMSKLISENKDDSENVLLLKSSVLFLSIIGVIFSLLMLIFSKTISRLQGNILAWKGYVFLSPSIFFVSLISCFRGYFQGYGKMLPTALSQVIEQLVKFVIAITLLSTIKKDLSTSVSIATLAVTISELFALLFLITLYIKSTKKYSNLLTKSTFIIKRNIKRIIKVCLPTTIVSILIPFSHVLDSFMVVNIIGKYSTVATNMYGLFSGAVMSVINLPVSLCYGIAVSSLPIISKSIAENKKLNAKANEKKSIFLTLIFSFIMFIMVLILSRFAINFLYKSLAFEEKELAIKLLKMSSPIIVFMSLLQTFNSLLIARNKFYIPVINLGIGVFIKTLLSFFLLRIEKLNIIASVISLIACY